MANKTVQALKISASFTPNEVTASGMLAVFNDTPAQGVRLHSGRMLLKQAVRMDFTDPDRAVQVTQYIAAFKAKLEGAGTLHSFTTIAGAVPAEDIVEFSAPKKAAKPAADAAGE